MPTVPLSRTLTASTMNLRTETDKIKLTKGTPKIFLDKKTTSGAPAAAAAAHPHTS